MSGRCLPSACGEKCGFHFSDRISETTYDALEAKRTTVVFPDGSTEERNKWESLLDALAKNGVVRLTQLDFLKKVTSIAWVNRVRTGFVG